MIAIILGKGQDGMVGGRLVSGAVRITGKKEWLMTEGSSGSDSRGWLR